MDNNRVYVKRKILQATLILINIYFCVACSITPEPLIEPTAQTLAQSPAALPRFISYISPVPGSQIERDQKICLEIYSGGIFLPRDTQELLGRQMQETSFTINGSPFPMFTFIQVNIPGAVWEVVNGVPLTFREFCFSLPLATGNHLLTVSVPKTSGEVLEYSWSYQVQ